MRLLEGTVGGGLLEGDCWSNETVGGGLSEREAHSGSKTLPLARLPSAAGGQAPRLRGTRDERAEWARGLNVFVSFKGKAVSTVR